MSENCHCGSPVVGESDATPGPAARVLCETCLPVRCDAYPGACEPKCWRHDYEHREYVCTCPTDAEIRAAIHHSHQQLTGGNNQ